MSVKYSSVYMTKYFVSKIYHLLYSAPGLANFNPEEGHIILKGSPEGRICV